METTRIPSSWAERIVLIAVAVVSAATFALGPTVCASPSSPLESTPAVETGGSMDKDNAVSDSTPADSDASALNVDRDVDAGVEAPVLSTPNAGTTRVEPTIKRKPDSDTVQTPPIARGPYTTGETVDLDEIAPSPPIVWEPSPYGSEEIRPKENPAPSKVEIQGNCPRGQIQCEESCANLRNDVKNCGECGLACRSQHSANLRCEHGVCAATCDSGWADCDNDGSTCETNVSSSSQNCGTCGKPCQMVSINGVERQAPCIAGQCILPNGVTRCGDGYVYLSTSREHCGACGHACPADRNCVDGSCKCADVANCNP
jgi:hypothetical protein